MMALPRADSTRGAQQLVLAAYFRPGRQLAAAELPARMRRAPPLGFAPARYSRLAGSDCLGNRRHRTRPKPGRATPSTAKLRSKLDGIAWRKFSAYPIFVDPTRHPLETLTRLKEKSRLISHLAEQFLVPDAGRSRPRKRPGRRKPASVYGLLDVAKPKPMGQSDWPLRFDDAPSAFLNQIKARPRLARNAQIAEHRRARIGQTKSWLDGGCERLGRSGFGAYEYRGPGLLSQSCRLSVGLSGTYAGSRIYPPYRGWALYRRLYDQLGVECLSRDPRPYLRSTMRARLPSRPGRERACCDLSPQARRRR